MTPPQPEVSTRPSCADDHDPHACTVAEAKARMAAAIAPVEEAVRLPLRTALGRVLAGDVVAPVDVPNHTNAAMDGYALAGTELPGSGSRDLRVAGKALAGAPFRGHCGAGECVRIMTGAPMPPGTDTVVMQEKAEALADGGVRIGSGHRPGQNVRAAGEDVAAGGVVLPAGHRLTPADLGVLASLGLGEVGVRRPVRVAFFSTGDELRAVGEPLGPGEVYDSNRYTLHGMLARLGVESLDFGVVPDDPAALGRAFADAAAVADAVITSGGVSVGEADHIKAILGDRGRLDLWQIAMKPGRPLTFGRVGDALFFGLPGNPVAVMVTFYQFVQPALGLLSGAGWRDALTVEATCTERLKKRPGRFEFSRGRLGRDREGRLTVALAGPQGSGILTSMSRADCFILLAEDNAGVEAGEPVTVQPFAGLV